VGREPNYYYVRVEGRKRDVLDVRRRGTRVSADEDRREVAMAYAYAQRGLRDKRACTGSLRQESSARV
jgi:hypothetical protein